MIPWEEVAGVKDPEPKARAVAEGFHLSAEGPGGAAAGPRAGTRDEGLRPRGGAEGPAWGFEAMRGGAESTRSTEDPGTVFFIVGPRMCFRVRHLPNTTRASPICSSVPQIEMWCSSRRPDFNV